MARSEGFEPPALGSEVHSSVQLSYERFRKWGERWDLNPRPLEPQSSALTGLSYAHHYILPFLCLLGAPGGSRTPSLRIRSPLLYPIELQAQMLSFLKTKWSGKRVSNPRQPAWKASALPTELFPLMVGVRGFEPPTPCSQSRCASQTALHPETKVLYSISN